MINNHIWGPEFNKKEIEIRKLKAELSRVDAEKTRPSLFTQPQPTPVSPPFFETYAPFYTPSRPQQPVYNQFFGFSHLQPTPQLSSPKKSRSKVKIFEPRPKATFSSSTSTIPPEESPQDIPEPLKKDKSPMDQYHYHTVQTQSSAPETNHSTSSSAYDSSKTFTDSESEYADITSILMATETADPSASTSTPIVDDNPSDQASHTDPVPPPVHEHSTKPSSASWFTFDDIPHHKWAARLQEFVAWIDLQGTKPNAQPQAILREFMARSTGSLRDWLESLGEYRQLQFMESPIGTALSIIREQFIGENTASTEADRKEYHQMKCCSLKRHLLDAHYKRMSILFYKLNGFNEPSLKHVFIASLPSELQPDLQRKLIATNLSITDISLGKIFQMAMLSLDKICEQKAFFKDLMEDKKPFSEAWKEITKCCSLNAKDLDFHYKRMSLLFYKLNGFNEPTLKHVFLASLPEELQPDIQRQLIASNLALDNISLGKIFQLAKTCLDKLCEQKQFFKELLKDKEPFRSACKKPYLQIKCKKKKDCDYSPKKKRHFRKFRTPYFSSRPRRSRKPYRFFLKKSSSSREFKRRKSSRCFICKKKGHYAKDYPNKREKYIRLVEHLQATTDYSPDKDELEFYFSEQDEPNDETVFALQNSSDDSDSDQFQVIFHQQLLSLDTTVPIPSIKLHILPSKFQRHVPAIGLIDIGAQRSMLNPHILPPTYWTKSKEHFKAVNGKLFTTSLITKKLIGIQIFPNCVIWTKVIGSTLPNKDILLGFDIIHQIKHLQIIPTGIHVKSMFKPFTDIMKLYNLSETPQSYQDISTKLLSFCPESHSEFTHPNPLWKNKSFFIKLPFKLNEDINPTKATHPGISPSDLLLAQKECSQLLAQGSHDEHRQLLTQFYDIIQSHGIMLSAKKSTIATDNIEFLDQQLSKKQVQQFLGIINYIRDFIPHVDHYIHHLSALLKKKPPEWNADHTTAVTTLKQIAQNPPPLKLITDGRRILQTDASDESWGAILLKELNDKERFIAYASGQFSDTQKHYHSVFKEILAVKNGIKKFEYHLIGHHFLIRMDSSAFPNIFNFKGLTLDPSKETTEDVLWYVWCLTVLYATKLVLLISPTLEHLLNPDNATSLTWTLLEWFSPILWWRKKLQQLSDIYNLDRMPAPEAQLFTSIFVIHKPYFQHPDTNLFWTQDQDPHHNPPKLTKPLRCPAPSLSHHPPNPDTEEIVLIHLAVVPTRCGIRAYHSLYPRPRNLALIPTWVGPNSAPKELSKGEDCPALISDQELWLASDVG
ncbi:hypothetical protein KPL71_014578 [Citrus sinensis]|uniref:Uncharacterized protein n=1 Tax=Citrus sinensis TaxID=2711 RepID=A0ACB8KCJ4_CITSI|nr:hypothetical protein KPL71_014578 [Citrus sinensis]